MVRCANCGFLGKRALESKIPQLTYEMTLSDRESGNNPTYSVMEPVIDQPGVTRPISLRAVCYRGVYEPFAEQRARGAKEGGGSAKALVAIINEDRDCDKWHPYSPGLDPLRHLEDFRMQQLEDNRREFERRLVEMQINAERKIGNVGVWIGIAAVILAVAQVVSSVPALQRLLHLD